MGIKCLQLYAFTKKNAIITVFEDSFTFTNFLKNFLILSSKVLIIYLQTQLTQATART